MSENYKFLVKKLGLICLLVLSLNTNIIAEKQIAQHTVNLAAADDVRYDEDPSGNLITIRGISSNGIYSSVTFEVKNAKGNVTASGSIAELVGQSSFSWFKSSKRFITLAWTDSGFTTRKAANFKLSKKGAKIVGETLSMPLTTQLEQEGKNFFSYDYSSGFIYKKYTGFFKEVGSFTEAGNFFEIARHKKDYIVRTGAAGGNNTFKRYNSKFKQVGETFSVISPFGASIRETKGKFLITYFTSPTNITRVLVSQTFKGDKTIASGDNSYTTARRGYVPPVFDINFEDPLSNVPLMEKKLTVTDITNSDGTNEVVVIKGF